jgi:hypothetical protein
MMASRAGRVDLWERSGGRGEDRMRASLVLLGSALLALGACAPDPGPSGDAASRPDDVLVAAPTYACGRFAFDPAVLQRPGDAERDDGPAASALRDYLAAPDTDRTALPMHGWTLIGLDGDGAQFVAAGADPMLPIVSVTVRQDRGSWRAIDGGWCEARRVLTAGINTASWELQGGQAENADAKRFVALVREEACASGRTAAGRIVGPEIREQPDAVIVTFGVRALEDRLTVTCEDALPTSVQVTLPHPLGHRMLLDGAFLPPRDPSPPACCGAQSSGALG